MAARIIRSLEDFCRHGATIELLCGCGHRAELDPHWVLGQFRARKWSTHLGGALWFADAYARFYCTRCFTRGRGKVRPKRIGPGER